VPLEQLEQRSAARRVPSRNAAGWASSRLQSQLQLQGTANASSNTSGSGLGRPSSAATSSTRRPLPGAPVRRTSRDDVTSANASFSSQGSGRSQGAAAGQGMEGAQRKVQGDERSGEQVRRLSDQTPQRHLRVEARAGDERLTTSALRGGAASGLLSLARS
jgi:hypothetical protein